MTAVSRAAEAGRPAASRRMTAPIEWAALVVLALVVHAVVLRFVFPGYYRPFWPFHSDFYIAPELANTPAMPAAILGLPRPVGYGWLYLTGLFGVRGAVVCDLLLVCANGAATILCLRRCFGVERGAPFFAAACLYLFLMFAHPAQYPEALYDAFSQVSYSFVLIGLALGWNRRPLVLQGIAFGLGLLAKETYFPVALMILAACWLADAGPGRRGTLLTGAALVAGLAIALIDSRLVRSEYMGFGSGPASPYHVDLSPGSLAHEWWAYAAEAGLALWLYVGAAFAAALICTAPAGRKALAPLAILPLAGLVSWLPNSLLPNHHMFGYSWLGALLILAPILALPRLWRPGRRWLFIALIAIGFLAPLGLGAAYARNGWLLEQQQRQARLMIAVGTKLAQLPPDSRRVLVTGLDFPFSPFDHPRSLYRYRRTLPTFSIVIYEPKQFTLIQQPAPARWITPDQAMREPFDAVWMFGEDGSSVQWRLSPPDETALRSLGLPAVQLALYPAAAGALGLDGAKGGLNLDGYHLLGCGSAFANYHRYDLALTCLKPSEMKIPDNPYPHFFAGLADEKLARIADAKAEFLSAIALDDKAKPNPAFRQALDKLGQGGAGS